MVDILVKLRYIRLNLPGNFCVAVSPVRCRNLHHNISCSPAEKLGNRRAQNGVVLLAQPSQWLP
jgi:hypothetical protein